MDNTTPPHSFSKESTEMVGLQADAIISDLERKAGEIEGEDQMKERHKRELEERNQKYSSITNTISVLKAMYPTSTMGGPVNTLSSLTPAPQPSHSPLPIQLDIEEEYRSGVSSNEGETPPDDEEVGPRKRGVLRLAILDIIGIADTFLLPEEVTERAEKYGLDKQTVRVGLKDARRARAIVGYPVTHNDGKTYLNGLATFCVNKAEPSYKNLKPEYQEKVLQRAVELNLVLNDD